MLRVTLMAAVLAAPAVAQELRAPDQVTGADDAARSAALFTEMGKVLQHPRCLNCHPVTGGPTQGDDMQPHNPPIVRGEAINTGTGYGYDIVTMMQETKTQICNVEKA